MTDTFMVPAPNKQPSAHSQADAASVAPRGMFRPRSELRLNRALENLSMSREEKVLKVNYGHNYESHLQSLSKQLSQRSSQKKAQNRVYSAHKTRAKASLIPPHLTFSTRNPSRQNKLQLKTYNTSTNFTSFDPYSLRDGMSGSYGERDAMNM